MELICGLIIPKPLLMKVSLQVRMPAQRPGASLGLFPSQSSSVLGKELASGTRETQLDSSCVTLCKWRNLSEPWSLIHRAEMLVITLSQCCGRSQGRPRSVWWTWGATTVTIFCDGFRKDCKVRCLQGEWVKQPERKIGREKNDTQDTAAVQRQPSLLNDIQVLHY